MLVAHVCLIEWPLKCWLARGAASVSQGHMVKLESVVSRHRDELAACWLEVSILWE